MLLFDALVERLGALAVVDSAEKGTQRWLYRRVAEGSADIVPWRVAHVLAVPLNYGIVNITEDDAADWWKDNAAPEEQRKTSRLRGLRSGRVMVHDGQQKLELGYGGDGLLAERCIDHRFPGRLDELVDVLAGKGVPGYERTAEFLAALDHGRHGPGRVRMPVPKPGGVTHIWVMGRGGARRALLDGRVPASARFIVSDGIVGTAVGWGTTLEEAQAAFDAEVRRELPRADGTLQSITDDYDDDGNLIARGKPPFPIDPEAEGEEPGPPSPPEVDPITGRIEFGAMVLRGPKSDVPAPEFTPETLPTVVVPLEPVPAAPPPFGRWIRTLGELGATRPVVRLKAGDGYVLVGEQALLHVERGRLLEMLDEADERASVHEGACVSGYEAMYRFEDRVYRWESAGEGHHGRFRYAGGHSGPRFDAAAVEGDELIEGVRRHVKIRRGSRS